MNYKPIILSILTTAIAACSSSQQGEDVTPEEPPTGVRISFGGNSDSWQDVTTRAGGTGLENVFQSFRVWGYKTTDETLGATQTVMDGYNVQHYDTDGNKGWEYIGVENAHLSAAQTVKYWDYAATSYRFLAYSPADADISVQDNENGKAFSAPFAYSEDAKDADLTYFSDAWFTSNQHDEKPYGSTVTLTFRPLIAKMRFLFSYPEKTTRIKIENITFQDSRFKDAPTTADTPLRGTITATYAMTGRPSADLPQLSWTAAAENATGSMVFKVPYEEAADRIHILTDASLYGKWYFVAPMDIAGYQQGAYVINAIIDGNHSSAIVPAGFMQWKAGYQYSYIFKITEAGTNITFDKLMVEEWKDAPNIDNNGSGTAGW